MIIPCIGPLRIHRSLLAAPHKTAESLLDTLERKVGMAPVYNFKKGYLRVASPIQIDCLSTEAGLYLKPTRPPESLMAQIHRVSALLP